MSDGPASERDAVLRRAADLATAFLESLDGRRVGAVASRAELLVGFSEPLPERGTDATLVIEELATRADPGLVASAGGRYFGFVIGGALPVAIAAEWLTSAWDQNAALFVTSPAASVVEEVTADWLLDLLDLPRGASVGFVTGGQMANFTCLAAARHAVLERAGWDVESDGLFGAPEVTVIVGEEAHATILTALRYLGLGQDRVVRIPCDDQGRMQPGPLRDAIDSIGGPLIVCLQAGNVNTGAFDPFAELIAAARSRRNAWVHVDGAFGLWARVSPSLSSHAAGVEAADSWSVDGHKWLNVPYDSGYAIIADPTSLHAALSPTRAAYMQYGATERDSFNYTPEFSRRARGFASYAALRVLGRDGVIAMIERSCELARRMADLLGTNDQLDVLNEVVLNQVLVRCRPPKDGDPSRHLRDVVNRVQADGIAWLGATSWHGMDAMRISVSNWSTTEADIDRAAEAILRAILAAERAPAQRADHGRSGSTA